jgi:hypothetical protein
MKFDATQITKLARETGFLADNLEKALRLRELLTELHKHPFLRGKLVLKGERRSIFSISTWRGSRSTST